MMEKERGNGVSMKVCMFVFEVGRGMGMGDNELGKKGQRFKAC